MRKNWEVKKLGDVCEISYGNRVVKSRDRGSLYPVYGGGGATFSVDSFNREDAVIISRFGMSPKCVRFVKGKFFLNDSGLSLIANKNILCQSYLDMAMFALNDVIYSLGKGAAQKNLDVKAFNKLSIKYPISFIDQQQIVEELDCLTSIIDKQKKQLEELDNLAQSIFYDMFGDPIVNEKGWKTSTIDNVCSSIIRGPFGSALKKEFFVEKDDSTYKVYEQKNAIKKDAFIGTYYISKEMYKSLSRFEIFPNDIIMSCSGTIGELFVIPFDAERGIINQALLKFTLNKNIEQNYFLFMMNLMKSKMDIKGCGIQNIGSVRYIKATKFGLPPLTLQQEFASKIEAIENQKELINKSIKETEYLFNSRMDYYFN